LNTVKNEHFDAYLLSESSLFVYRNRAILKTCGTTRLLSCLPLLEQYARNTFEGEMEIEYALFTRRNFKYPEKQPTPHSCWDEEKQTLLKHFKNGTDTVIGDINEDHFYVFMEDNRSSTEEVDKYSTVEVAMTDLSRESMNNFYKNENFVCESQTLSESGITNIIPQEAIIDSLMFNPFGFSLNALNNSSYYTMHITPQKECSYVSYETNRETTDHDYLNIIRRVTETFTPEKYTIIDIRSKHFKDLLPSKEPTCEKLSKIEISKHFTLNFYGFSIPGITVN
jgi:S-adenosylmethionine decarboxylase